MKSASRALAICLALAACNQGPRPLPPAGADAGPVVVTVTDAATSAVVADAGEPVASDPPAPTDDGSVRPRSEVVMAEWFSTGGGPRPPAEGGFDFSQRVFADGRYEMRSDASVETTKDMRFVNKKVPKVYRPVHQLTRVEMEAFEALVRRTVVGLAPRYEERSTDRGFYKFIFRIDGKEHTSEVVGHLSEPHPLTVFTREVQTIHKSRTKVTETVRAWTKSGAIVERAVPCSMTHVAALSQLPHRMFPHTNAKPTRPPAATPAAGVVLLEVRYLEDGKLTETYRVMGNGKVSGTTASGVKSIDAQLTPDETQALLVALEDIDWNGSFACR